MPQELQIALIAAAAALSGSLLGALFTRTTEHQQWLRNQKTKAYDDFLELCHRFDAVMRDPMGSLDAGTVETVRIERLLILDRLKLLAPMTVHIEAVQIETLQYQLNLLRNGLQPSRRWEYSGTEAEIKAEMSRLIKRLHKKMRRDLGVSDGPTRFTDVLVAVKYLRARKRHPRRGIDTTN
jgi:hypothetical protein